MLALLRPFRLGAIGVASGLALLAAGCGGDSESASATATGAATPAAASSQTSTASTGSAQSDSVSTTATTTVSAPTYTVLGPPIAPMVDGATPPPPDAPKVAVGITNLPVCSYPKTDIGSGTVQWSSQVVRDAATFAQMWQACGTPVPSVDFSTSTVVAVSGIEEYRNCPVHQYISAELQSDVITVRWASPYFDWNLPTCEQWNPQARILFGVVPVANANIRVVREPQRALSLQHLGDDRDDFQRFDPYQKVVLRDAASFAQAWSRYKNSPTPAVDFTSSVVVAELGGAERVCIARRMCTAASAIADTAAVTVASSGICTQDSYLTQTSRANFSVLPVRASFVRFNARYFLTVGAPTPCP